MHNVDVEAVNATKDRASADGNAALMEVHLEGRWNVDSDDVQFSGEVEFPSGSVSFNADFPDFLGGQGRAPAPLAYCFYGAMCCYGATFATQAALEAVPIDSMTISLSLDVNFLPALGLADVPPMSEFKFHLAVETSASEEELARIKQLTDERCPAIWAMNNPVPHTVHITKT